MRAFDATLAGLILISLIYLGTVFLIIDIPIFSYVNPVSLTVVVIAMFIGLAFGLFAGRWYTKEQLNLLNQKNEFQGLGTKRIYYAMFSGLAIFLAFAFFTMYYGLMDLANSLVVFTISALFTLFIIRIILISFWEKKNRKIILFSFGWNNRVFAIPNPDNVA
ncbi:MAG: hypothetical protein ACQCN4_08780 [Candidatus Bathyarchaeia archaeon]|jgi:small-conductance mechanosensitive channel